MPPTPGPRLDSFAPADADPTGLRPRPPGKRNVELDVWRSVAALLVVVYHTWQTMRIPVTGHENAVWRITLHYIETMVDVFFVISAVVLVPPFIRKVVDREPHQRPRAFLQRRFFRLVPLYWLICLVVWSYRNYSFTGGQWLDLLEHLFFLQQFDSKRIFFTIGPAWSLAVEVVFYLAIPVWIGATARVTRRLGSRRARVAMLYVGPVLAIVASGIYKYAGRAAGVPTTRYAWWFSSPAKFDVLGFGCIVAVWLGTRSRDEKVGPAGTVALRALGLGILATLPWVVVNQWIWFHTVAGLGFSFLVAASMGGTQLVTHRVAPALFRRIGSWGVWVSGITFSLYLSHEAVVVAFHNDGVTPVTPSHLIPNIVINLGVAIPVALLVWALVEQPTYRLRWLPEMRQHAPSGAPRREGRPTAPAETAAAPPAVPKVPIAVASWGHDDRDLDGQTRSPQPVG